MGTGVPVRARGLRGDERSARAASGEASERRPEELEQFLSAFPPEIAKLFLAGRRVVLKAAPDANELVYDAYNAVSAAYSFSDRLKEAFLHVAAYSGHVNLGFNRGAELPDPSQLLRGSGARIRHIRLESPGDLKNPALGALVAAAEACASWLADVLRQGDHRRSPDHRRQAAPEALTRPSGGMETPWKIVDSPSLR